MIIPPETIATRRLLLRKPRLSDVDAIFDNYACDPGVTRYVTWRPHRDRDETTAFIESLIERWDSGNEYSWVLTVPPEDFAIGMIACRLRGHAADIGYVLSRKSWDRGYMTEATQAVVDWALGLESIYRVWAVCDVENPTSARVMEKVGMEREGILRRYIIHPNISSEPRDCFVYSKVR